MSRTGYTPGLSDCDINPLAPPPRPTPPGKPEQIPTGPPLGQASASASPQTGASGNPSAPRLFLWVDREAARQGQPAWTMEYKGKQTNLRSFDFGDRRVISHQPPEPPLHPEGPAYWLEII
jgi:hypothetical protein